MTRKNKNKNIKNEDIKEKKMTKNSDKEKMETADKNAENNQVNEEKMAEEKNQAEEKQTVEEKKQADEEKDKPKEKKELSWEEKYKEANDKYLRLSAEFDNYRKRTLKEKMELTKSAGEEILVSILPVMDNFERAMKSMEDAKDLKAVKEGIDLIYGKFKEFLQQKGVKEIEAQNLELDTDIHEAVTKIPAPDKKLKGKIVDVIEKGYYLNDKVIRYSKVVVGE